GRACAGPPEAMMNVLAPDLPVETIEVVIMSRDVIRPKSGVDPGHGRRNLSEWSIARRRKPRQTCSFGFSRILWPGQAFISTKHSGIVMEDRSPWRLLLPIVSIASRSVRFY